MCRIILWVHNIYHGMLCIFLLSTPLPLNSTDDDSPTNFPIKILFTTPFRVYLIICFILSITFPLLFCVSTTNLFVKCLQKKFPYRVFFLFVTCYVHLAHTFYMLEVCIAWDQVIIYTTTSSFYPDPWLLPLLYWLCVT